MSARSRALALQSLALTWNVVVLPMSAMPASPPELWFYHLERSSVDQVLPELLERTIKRGWRAVVRSPDEAELKRLDDWLWTFRDESFLAHGLASEPMPERQPILLTTGNDNPNRAHALFLLSDAPLAGLAGYERGLYLFDGRDEARLADARARWRKAKAGGIPVSYWRQTEQGWEKQA